MLTLADFKPGELFVEPCGCRGFVVEHTTLLSCDPGVVVQRTVQCDRAGKGLRTCTNMHSAFGVPITWPTHLERLERDPVTEALLRIED